MRCDHYLEAQLVAFAVVAASVGGTHEAAAAGRVLCLLFPARLLILLAPAMFSSSDQGGKKPSFCCKDLPRQTEHNTI